MKNGCLRLVPLTTEATAKAKAQNPLAEVISRSDSNRGRCTERKVVTIPAMKAEVMPDADSEAAWKKF